MGQTYTFHDSEGNAAASYRSEQPLSKVELDSLAENYKNAGFLDPEKRQNELMSRQDLETNSGLIDAYRTYYKRKNGNDFQGDNKELISDYMEQMRYYDSNIGSILNLTTELGSDYYNEQERQALAVMFHSWENTQPWYNENNGKWEAFLDHVEANVTDPANLAAFFTGGIGAGGSLTAKEIAKASLRKILVQYAKKGFVPGAVAGAAYTAPASMGRQYNMGELGLGEGITAEQTLKDTALGAAFGGTFGSIGGATTGVLNKTSTRRLEKLAAKEAAAVSTKTGNLTADEVGKSGRAMLSWADTLADSSIQGEARQAAQKEFLDNIGEGMARFFNAKNRNNAGKSVSMQQMTEQATGLLKTLGINEKNMTPDEVLNRVVRGYENKKLDAANFENWNALVIHMESWAVDRFKKAMLSDDPKAYAYFDAASRAMATAQNMAGQSGRALSIQKMRNRLGPTAYHDALEFAAKNGVDSQDMALILAKASDSGPTWRKAFVDGLNEFWINNILGAFNTMVINTGGSYVHLLERNLIDIAAGGKLALTGKGGVQLSAAISQLAVEHMQIFGSLKYSLKALARSDGYIDPRRHINDVGESAIAIGDRNFNFMEPSTLLRQEDESIGMYLANWLGNTNRALGGRGMAATDELIKQMAFRGKLFSSVLQEKLKGVQGAANVAKAVKEAKDEAQQLLNKHIDDIGQGMQPSDTRIKAAMEHARLVTFQNDLKDDAFGAVGRFTEKHILRPLPVMRQVMPFVRTPMNLLSHWGERTPGLQNTSKELQRMMRGSPEERAKAQAIIGVGIAVWANVLYYAGQDRLEGSLGTDPKRKDQRLAGGALPDSIEMEDGSKVGFRKFDPYAKSYRLMAKIMEVMKDSRPENVSENFINVTGAIAMALTETPTTQGLSDVLSIPAGIQDTGDVAAKKFQAMLPYARLFNELARMSGDEQLFWEVAGVGETATDRVLDSMGKSTVKAYPFLNDPEDPIDVRRDPLSGKALTGFQNLGFSISGIPTIEGREDAVREEIERLGMTVTKVPHIQYGSVNLKKFTVKPNGNRTVYDYYQDLVGTMRIPNVPGSQDKNGATLYEYLDFIISNDSTYRETLTDGSRQYQTKERQVGTRERRIKDAINMYRTLALAELRKPQHLGPNHPVIQELDKAKLQQTLSESQKGERATPNLLAPLMGNQ
jgi:hypothetical protein